MFLSPLAAATATFVLVQATLVSGNHYMPPKDEILAPRSSPFSAHVNRPRDGFHRTGSLRKRCSRKSSSQITLTGSSDSNDDSGSASSSSDSDTASASNSTTISRVSSSNTTSHTGTWLKKNCVTWGWITDDGDKAHGSTGSLETPAQINSAVGTDAQYFGAYAHIQGDEYKKGACLPSTQAGGLLN